MLGLNGSASGIHSSTPILCQNVPVKTGLYATGDDLGNPDTMIGNIKAQRLGKAAKCGLGRAVNCHVGNSRRYHCQHLCGIPNAGNADRDETSSP